MSDLQRNLPDLPALRRACDIARIRALSATEASYIRRPRWRRRGVVIGAIATGVVGGGLATAAVVLPPTTPTNVIEGRCYSVASQDVGPDFPGASVQHGHSSQGPTPPFVATLLEDCAVEWRMGFFRVGSPGLHPQAPDALRVPELTACVLPNGDAAVFPGPASTCAHLGFAPVD